jgi:hypothetical protein
LAIFIASFLLLLPEARAAERDFHVGCMGVRSFFEWSQAQAFPYKVSRQKSGAIRNGFKRLDLGLSLDRVRALSPEPDWAVETRQGCVWKYVLKMSDTTVATRYRGFALAYRNRALVMIGDEGNPWEIVEH